jgi:hypothetical protein
MIALEKVRQTLEELKLTTAASYLESRLQYAAEHELSYVAFLSDLLGAELEQRNKRQTEAKIHRAHLPYRKTFEEFDFTYQPTVDPKRIENVRAFAFIESASNVLYGGACCQDTFFEKIRCVWCRVKKPHTFHSSIPSHPNPPALRATGSVKGVLSLDRFRREEDTGCGMDNHLLVVDAGRRSVLQGLMRPPMVIKVNVGHDARSRFPR